MNRAFKTEFHNGGEKTIATISFSVNNGKLFNELDEQGRMHLCQEITDFQKKLESIKDEIYPFKIVHNI
jgi:hypothetical protein